MVNHPRRNRAPQTLDQAFVDLRKRIEGIGAHLDEFSPLYIDEVAEQLMDLAEFLREAAVRLKKGHGQAEMEYQSKPAMTAEFVRKQN
jgi:hypothetical protein